MPSQSAQGRGIVLGGFMGAGKSTVGRALAERLEWPFLDTDSEVERVYGPIVEQVAREGIHAFRAREARVIEGLSGGCQVIATGGGVFADLAHRRRLAELGWLVTLDVSLEQARARTRGDSGRPLLGDADRLFAERRAAYRDVDLVLSADASVQSLVERLVSWVQVAADVHVQVPGQGYPVQIRDQLEPALGPAVRRSLDPTRVILVTEENVGPLWAEAALSSLRGAGIACEAPIVLAAGEANKGLESWSAAVDGLLARGVDRHTPVVALGGGVLGDIAGFAASSVLRGVPWIQVPTTLLAMADSSVGGKTGINHATGKNLIGAFHQPSLVVAALDTLDTLDPRTARSGLAEIVKAALIDDVALWQRLGSLAEDLGRLEPVALAAVLSAAISVKAAIVSEDVHERGRRAVLNLGHTAGHALETALGHGQLHHGEAVAIGLCAEAEWAANVGLGPADLPGLLVDLFTRMGLPTEAPPVSSKRLLAAGRVDKKRRGAMLRQPVCVRPGHVQVIDLAIDDLPEFLTALNRPPG